MAYATNILIVSLFILSMTACGDDRRSNRGSSPAEETLDLRDFEGRTAEMVCDVWDRAEPGGDPVVWHPESGADCDSGRIAEGAREPAQAGETYRVEVNAGVRVWRFETTLVDCSGLSNR
ncbi:MAG: hypothetical protein ACNA8W_18635 [Bradymonadaceae bacterium]